MFKKIKMFLKKGRKFIRKHNIAEEAKVHASNKLCLLLNAKNEQQNYQKIEQRIENLFKIKKTQ